jgi:2'-5' RNA ligase
MKYFIGAPIPGVYKNKIEMLRAEFRFLTTEPHITIVPPPALPDDDIFIKNVIEVCANTPPINIKLGHLGQFSNRVLYVNVDSPELIKLYENIFGALKLEKEKRGYTPHLTVVKERPKRPIDIDEIKKRAEVKLLPPPEYTLKYITIYHQPKERFIYVPYMQVPLGK